MWVWLSKIQPGASYSAEIHLDQDGGIELFQTDSENVDMFT